MLLLEQSACTSVAAAVKGSTFLYPQPAIGKQVARSSQRISLQPVMQWTPELYMCYVTQTRDSRFAGYKDGGHLKQALYNGEPYTAYTAHFWV